MWAQTSLKTYPVTDITEVAPVCCESEDKKGLEGLQRRHTGSEIKPLNPSMEISRHQYKHKKKPPAPRTRCVPEVTENWNDRLQGWSPWITWTASLVNLLLPSRPACESLRSLLHSTQAALSSPTASLIWTWYSQREETSCPLMLLLHHPASRLRLMMEEQQGEIMFHGLFPVPYGGQ